MAGKTACFESAVGESVLHKVKWSKKTKECCNELEDMPNDASYETNDNDKKNKIQNIAKLGENITVKIL